MVGEIADFVAKHKAKLFAGPKKTESKRPGSVGDLGKSLEQNDPETLKFIKKHETSIHGEKPEVATKYSLDTSQNKRMKPKEGVYEEDELGEKYIGFEKLKSKLAAKGDVSDPGAVAASIGRKKYGKKKFQAAAAHHHKLGEEEEMEEVIESKCPKCGASECSCQHEECSGGRKLRTAKKLKEETLSNFIALDILEQMKAIRLEGVDSSIHKVSPGDPDYTGGMRIGLRPKAEVQTEHKPVVSSSEKSKKLKKTEVKEGHKDPMPHLDNPSYGSGCTGHEDPRPTIKKPHGDPTKIPATNQVPNSTQPKSGVLDRKKKVTEEIIDEGLGNWLAKKADAAAWGPPKPQPTTKPKPKRRSQAKVKLARLEPVPGGMGTSFRDTIQRQRGKWERPEETKERLAKSKGKPVKREVPGGFSIKGNMGKWVQEGVFNRVSDPQLRKQAIGAANKIPGKPVPELKKNDIDFSKMRKAGTPITKLKEDELQETLPPSASASDYIHDFVHSKNKIFKGDTKKKRIKRALGAYYHKQRSE